MANSKSKISNQQRAYVRRKIRQLAKILELDKWRIKILFGNVAQGYAKVEPWTDQPVADITIGHEFWDLSGEWRVQCLIHELLHLRLAPLDDSLRRACASKAYPVIHAVQERCVDELAWALLPLVPPWGK